MLRSWEAVARHWVGIVNEYRPRVALALRSRWARYRSVGISSRHDEYVDTSIVGFTGKQRKVFCICFVDTPKP